MQLRFSHAVLYVRDLEQIVAFYRDVLGFAVTDRGPLDPANPGFELAFLSQVGSDHHQLAFAPMRGDGPSTTLDHIAFKVDSFADVKAMAQRLAGDGRATQISLISHGNAWSVYFNDPEGNRLEVFCDSPFHVQQPQARSWDLAMSEEEIRRATAEQFGGEPEFGPIEAWYEQHRRRHGG